MSTEVRSLALFVDSPTDVEDVRWMPARAERMPSGTEFVVPASVCVHLGASNLLYLAPEAAGQLAAGLLAALASADDAPAGPRPR